MIAIERPKSLYDLGLNRAFSEHSIATWMLQIDMFGRVAREANFLVPNLQQCNVIELNVDQ